MSMQGALKVLDDMANAAERIDAALCESLAYAGELAVSGIRTGDMSRWDDQTGNLRSSIGYVVCRSGRVVVESGFDTVSGGMEGSSTGKRLCEQLAREYSGFAHVLIIVAGMEYAVYVEAIDGKVVLTGGQLWLESNIGKIVRARVDAVISKFNKA